MPPRRTKPMSTRSFVAISDRSRPWPARRRCARDGRNLAADFRSQLRQRNGGRDPVAQQSASAASPGNAPPVPAAAWSSTGPCAEACTVSSLPGHKALNGPNTSPLTCTRTQPDSPTAGRSTASAPWWHQSLRTAVPPGVHQRHPCPPADAATASRAASAKRAVLSTAASLLSCPAAGTATPCTPACSQTARRPADAAASACARAPLTSSACVPSSSNSTTTAGHTISNGSTSPLSSRRRRPRPHTTAPTCQPHRSVPAELGPSPSRRERAR